MTLEEREQLEAAKSEITAWLADYDRAHLRLADVDPRLEIYCSDVAAHPREHNLWEQLSVRRFIRLVEKYGIDTKKVQVFFRFYESLKFAGKKGPTSYKLTPVQCFQFASIYGFWHDGRRVVREAVLYVPRKFSKTTSVAAIALYDLLFGEYNAECYHAANSELQAKRGFDVLRYCIRQLDPGEKYYRVNEQEIRSKRRDRSASAQCLTAGARTKDGLNASTVIMDEFSQARDSDLLTVLTTSMGVRDNPLTVIITTASDAFDGPFFEMLKGYKSVLLGEAEDDSLFAHLFEPDLGDAEDDPATWRKVHPHLGVTVNADFYEQEYRKAQRNGAEAMLAFRTKLLNVYTENQQRSWISAETARLAMEDFSLADLRGHAAMVSFDLSESDDFTAVSVGVYAGRGEYKFHTAYFFPEGALCGHPNEKLYRVWASQGFLHLLPGPVVDYDYIRDYILKLNSTVRVLQIGYDRYRAKELVNMLWTAVANEGGTPKNILVDMPQTYAFFTSPVELFEHGIKTGKIKIDPNPINAYCLSNAVLDFGTLENCKPIKRSHYQKIDGVITMLMCLRLFIDGSEG